MSVDYVYILSPKKPLVKGFLSFFLLFFKKITKIPTKTTFITNFYLRFCKVFFAKYAKMCLQKHRFRRCFPRENRMKKKNRQSKRVFLFFAQNISSFLTSFPYSNHSDVAKLCSNAFSLLVLPSKSQTKEKEGRNLPRPSCPFAFVRLFFA